jgi:PPOX class probable F420-dependent enzyme
LKTNKNEEKIMSKKHMLTNMQELCARSGYSHTVLLTSFRRNGQKVGTPVGMMSAHNKLYFMTPASTWKARSLAHTPHVRLALCTFQGKVLSPPAEGSARRLTGPEAKRGRKLICVGPYGFLMNLFFLLRYPGDKTAVYEVSLHPERQREAESANVGRAVFGHTL